LQQVQKIAKCLSVLGLLQINKRRQPNLFLKSLQTTGQTNAAPMDTLT